MDLKDLGVKPVKMIKGATGPYWQTASGKTGEFYMKFKFEPGNVVIDGLMQEVEVLQVNILYFGEKFDIPGPWHHIEQRSYVVDDKPVPGHLLGKFWMPMGEFQKAFKDMHDHCRTKLAPIIDQAVAELYKAAGCEPVIDMAGLFLLLSDGLNQDKLRCEPKMYVGGEWKENQKTLAKTMAKKYDHDESDSADE